MINRNKLRVLLAFTKMPELPMKQARTQFLRRLSDLEAPHNLTSATVVDTNGIRENEDLLEKQIDLLVRHDIHAITIVDSNYPQQLRDTLGERAPLFLFWKGNPDLLEDASIGFCGSRHASKKGLEVCADIVEQLVDKKMTVVAGYAAGVDQLAHLTALKVGGRTIAVLAEGMLNFNVRQQLAPMWDWSRTLVISEFLPNARWTVGRAMQRNRTIIGLSKGLIVIEAKESGGTFEAGKAALSLGHPLFAPTYDVASGIAHGNQDLIRRGAKEILKSRTQGRANIRPVLQMLEKISFDAAPPTFRLG